jgi:hypothetical protein
MKEIIKIFGSIRIKEGKVKMDSDQLILELVNIPKIHQIISKLVQENSTS